MNQPGKEAAYEKVIKALAMAASSMVKPTDAQIKRRLRRLIMSKVRAETCPSTGVAAQCLDARGKSGLLYRVKEHFTQGSITAELALDLGADLAHRQQWIHEEMSKCMSKLSF